MDRKNLRIGRKDFLEISQEILEKGKQFSFIARGTSMSPFIKEGDSVVVSPLSGPLSVGDVVLVRSDEGLILLHRIIQCLPTGVVTKGDSASEDDGFITAEDVFGKATQVSGSDFNFHLYFPFKYLISRRKVFDKIFLRFPFLKKLLKKILRIPE
jgi:hypothetical protein